MHFKAYYEIKDSSSEISCLPHKFQLPVAAETEFLIRVKDTRLSISHPELDIFYTIPELENYSLEGLVATKKDESYLITIILFYVHIAVLVIDISNDHYYFVAFDDLSCMLKDATFKISKLQIFDGFVATVCKYKVGGYTTKITYLVGDNIVLQEHEKQKEKILKEKLLIPVNTVKSASSGV